MAKTHDEVSEKEAANTNLGKIIMMEQFLWLLDIEEEFKGFTYVFYVKEINSAQDNDLKTMMIQIATESNKLIKKNQLTITEIKEQQEKNQQQTITKMEEQITKMEENQLTITEIKELMMKQQERTIEQIEQKFKPLLDFMNLQMATDEEDH